MYTRRNLFGRTLPILLLALIILPGRSAAQENEAVYSTCLFGSSHNSWPVTSYEELWHATNGDFTWDIENANNNRNQWNFIRLGRKSIASVGSITTASAYPVAITKVDLKIDAITATSINSIKLYTSSDLLTWNEVESFTEETGYQTVNVTNPATNLYYKIVFDCAAGSANGLVEISEVKYSYIPGADPYISASDVNIAYNETSGSIAYSINNAPSPAGTVTSVEVTSSNPGGWLTVFNPLTNPIALTCDANEGATNRTDTVTITYTYGDNQTVTKTVAVTQETRPTPSISAADKTIAYNVTSSYIAYKILNPVDGGVFNATLQNGIDWITNVRVESDTIKFSTTRNETNDDRSATFTLSYTNSYRDAEVRIVSLTQNPYQIDYADLPFSFDGGKGDIDNTTGITQDGLDGDYGSSPRLKFNGTDDWVIVKTNQRIGRLSFDIKGNSFSGGTFKVQTSSNGVDYSDLETYTSLGEVKSEEQFNYFDANVRYIKWVYTEKVSGNVALGNIYVDSPCEPITIAQDGTWTENFEDFESSFTPKTSLKPTAVNDDKAFRMDDGCWAELMDNGAPTICNPALYTNYHMNALGGTSSDNKVSVQFYNRLGSDPCILVLPEFSDDIATLQFSFKGCYYTTSGTLQIGYYHNGTFTSTTGAGFTITTGRNATPSTANYGPYIFPGAPSGSRIALRYTPVTNAGGINLDEFCVSHLDGRIFTTDGSWDNPANWTPGGIPTNGDNVYITAAATIPDEYEAHYKSITIQEGGQLIAPYTLPVTVQKSIEADHWKALAPAVYDNGETHLTPADGTNLTSGTYDLLAYDEATGTWINQKAHNNFTLNRGQGYIYRCSANNTLTFEGNTTVNDVTINLTATNAAGDLKGFNLIGNPFPHKVLLDRAFYSLNADGSWVEHPDGDSLLVGEAALVHVESNEELTFYAATRTTNPGTKGYMPPLPKGLCLNGNTQDVYSTRSTHFAHQYGNNIVVTGTGLLQAYDIMGRLLFSKVIDSQITILNSQFPGMGVYVLRLGEKSQKIIVK